MKLDTLFSLLETLPCGAYAMSLDQTIVFWNREAERLLGLTADEVVGRHCYDVVSGVSHRGLTPVCTGGCPSVRYLQAGLVPAQTRLQLAKASGEHSWMTVTPMVVSGVLRDAPLLVHLFDEAAETDDVKPTVDSLRAALTAGDADVLSDHPERSHIPAESSELSRRELDVLRLVALGWTIFQIGEELHISQHTVRNHIRNLRKKLDAGTKLDAVVKGLRLGLISMR